MAFYFDYANKYNKKDGDFTRLEPDYLTENIRLDFDASKILKLENGDILLGLNVISYSGIRAKTDDTFPIQLSVMFHKGEYELSRYNAETKKSEKYTQQSTLLDKVMLMYCEQLDTEVNYTGFVTLQNTPMLQFFVDGKLPIADLTGVTFHVSLADKSPIAEKVLSASNGQQAKSYAPAEKQADKIAARLFMIKQQARFSYPTLSDEDYSTLTLKELAEGIATSLDEKGLTVGNVYMSLLTSLLA